jgi:hypothetical protein
MKARKELVVLTTDSQGKKNEIRIVGGCHLGWDGNKPKGSFSQVGFNPLKIK